MKYLIALALCLSAIGFAGQTDEVTELRERIAACESRARYADREASRLLNIDYTSYRSKIGERDRNLERAKILQKKLAELEG